MSLEGGVEAVTKKRFRRGDRRQNADMPKVPFKDSNGATTRGCRRASLDRRMGNIEAEWIDEIVIS